MKKIRIILVSLGLALYCLSFSHSGRAALLEPKDFDLSFSQTPIIKVNQQLLINNKIAQAQVSKEMFSSPGIDAERPRGIKPQKSSGTDAERPRGIKPQKSSGIDAERPRGIKPQKSSGIDAERPHG